VSGTLPSRFYARDTVTVAQDLLGKILVVRSRVAEPLESPRALVTAGRIVETEAYHGEDPASHSSRGRTPRNSIMFGPPGHVYVYFIYGMYEMLNFVTEPEGRAGAVLIRAVEPIESLGETLMRERRPGCARHALANGPGKLCNAMGIRMSHKGERTSGPAIYVADDGYRPEAVSRSPRVGITDGKHELWRFFITDHPCVSRAPQNKQARRMVV
jgi:DNA-3-methyladenine glycosylase